MRERKPYWGEFVALVVDTLPNKPPVVYGLKNEDNKLHEIKEDYEKPDTDKPPQAK